MTIAVESDLVGKLCRNGELLSADKLCVVIELLACYILVCFVYSGESCRTRDVEGGDDFDICVGYAGGHHCVHVHVRSAPGNVLDRYVKSLAFAERLDIYAGDGLCADEAFIDKTLEVFALFSVCNRKLLDVALRNAEFFINRCHFVCVKIRSDNGAAALNGVGKGKAAAEHKHAENKRNYFFHVQFVLSRKSIYCSICKLRLC